MARILSVVFLFLHFFGSLDALKIEIDAVDVSKVETHGEHTIVRTASGRIFCYKHASLQFEYRETGYTDFILLGDALLVWTVKMHTDFTMYDLTDTTYNKTSFKSKERIESIFDIGPASILVVAEKRRFVLLENIRDIGKTENWQVASIPLWREYFFTHKKNVFYFHQNMIYTFTKNEFLSFLSTKGWYAYTDGRIAVRDDDHMSVYDIETAQLLQQYPDYPGCTTVESSFVFVDNIVLVNDKESIEISSDAIKKMTHKSRIRGVLPSDYILEVDERVLQGDFSSYHISRFFYVNGVYFALLHENRSFSSKNAVLITLEGDHE